jgi:hypothetical protein
MPSVATERETTNHEKRGSPVKYDRWRESLGRAGWLRNDHANGGALVGGGLQNRAGHHARTAGPAQIHTGRQSLEGPADGKVYFVYPDVAQNVLYVGQNAQYQRYQQLREQNQLGQEQLNAAEVNADWGAWGTWGGEGWWSPLSP